MLDGLWGLIRWLMSFAPFQFIGFVGEALWVLLGIGAFACVVLGVAAYRDRKDAERAEKDGLKPQDIKVERNSAASGGTRQKTPPPPPEPKPEPEAAKSKTAAQIFKETFPEIKVAPVPLPAVPFAIRIKEEDASSLRDGRPRPCLRVEFAGSVPVDVAADLSLLLTVEDLTSGTAQHVFATVDALQDERTGLFVERAKLGKVDPPGLSPDGWREIALFPTSFFQPPRAGRCRLRFSCLCVPSGNASLSVIDPVLRSRIYCSAVAEVFAELPIKGYLEEDYDREQVAGMIVCVAWGFAHALGGAELKCAQVISNWSAQASTLLGGTSGLPSASFARVVDGADRLGRSGGMGFLSACEQLARFHVPEAPEMAFELCCRLAKVIGGSSDASYSLLRDGALAMGVGPGEFARLMGVGLGGPLMATDEELVGLDSTLSKERVAKFLREQFGKWNARSASVRDPDERRQIAVRLNAIAKLRQKYL